MLIKYNGETIIYDAQNKITYVYTITAVSHILLNTIKNLKTVEFSESIETINAFSKVIEVNKYDEDIPPKLSIKTIKGYKDIAAEKYAKDNNFKFVAM